MNPYWMILISVAIVFFCGIIAAFRSKEEMGYWTVLAICVIAGAINLSKVMADWSSSVIFVASVVVALIFFGLGLELGSWLISWRQEKRPQMAEDGFSEFE